VVGAFYYLRVIWLMYFDKPGDLPGAVRAPAFRWVLGLNAAAVLALGILPDALLEICRQVILPGG
jgi:NADH-quinone oxidoreductase subunit N